MPHAFFILAAMSFVNFAGIKVAGNSPLSQEFAGLIPANFTSLPKLAAPESRSYHETGLTGIMATAGQPAPLSVAYGKYVSKFD